MEGTYVSTVARELESNFEDQCCKKSSCLPVTLLIQKNVMVMKVL